jgi:hypothetical protein
MFYAKYYDFLINLLLLSHFITLICKKRLNILIKTYLRETLRT